MIESFFTIAESAQGVYKEKGSKFLAFAHPVIDSEQIDEKLAQIRKEFYDASHHCYAWILGADKSKYKAFDDGEPNHSAGDPILNQIKSKNLTNILIVVVRYFGGVKLGIGGLSLAYKLSAGSALENATVIEITITNAVTIEYGYPETTLIKKLIHEFDLKVIHEVFRESCSLEARVKLSVEEKLRSRIRTLQQQGIDIVVI